MPGRYLRGRSVSSLRTQGSVASTYLVFSCFSLMISVRGLPSICSRVLAGRFTNSTIAPHLLFEDPHLHDLFKLVWVLSYIVAFATEISFDSARHRQMVADTPTDDLADGAAPVLYQITSVPQYVNIVMLNNSLHLSLHERIS